MKTNDDELIGESVSGEELTKMLEDAKRKARASHGILDEKERGGYSGRDSFRGNLDLSRNPGRSHTLRTHFVSGTAAYEIIGKFEWMLKQPKYRRDDRFVFMAVGKLRATCFKGDPEQRRRFSDSAFFKGMELLRRLGAISPRLERDGREGYIIAPHAALCVEMEDGKNCKWIGPTFVNRAAQGLVGWFSMTPDGWIWHAGTPELKGQK